ncbi:MAG: alkaline phosphatase family protein [Chitinophagaceae bacterium]|nr:alkaline phosphatase family protein [Chitinophagaceae bacterium]
MNLRPFFRNISLMVVLIPFFTYAQDTTQYVIQGRFNSPEQQNKPYVIMISADGFRYDLADKYNAVFLKRKRGEGVMAQSMQPSFPSMTFPNHYTLVTGLYPAHNGIVSNTFYSDHGKFRYTMSDRRAVTNPKWYGGIPLWVLAEKQQMLSACFYWVGSEAEIDSTFPTYYYHYNEAIPIERRLDIVRDWLQLPPERRPHMITFYLPEVDHMEHKYGVTNDSVEEAVQFVDHAVKRMNEITDSLGLPVNYIFVSDHGMMDIDTANPILVNRLVDTSKFVAGFNSTIIHLYAKNPKYIKKAYRELKQNANGYEVFLKKNTPKRWHYRTKDDYFDRLGDIMLVSDPGKVFAFSKGRVSAGNHGFDNAIPQMQATFYAWGPAFKNNLIIPRFTNVNVYPLIAQILGLQLMNTVDGKIDVLKNTLKDDK